MARTWAIVATAFMLSGCAWIPGWIPFIGHDDEGEDEPDVIMGRDGGGLTGEGPCTRKGRRWREGSRVCEDDVFTECFPDGQWHVIGGC